MDLEDLIDEELQKLGKEEEPRTQAENAVTSLIDGLFKKTMETVEKREHLTEGLEQLNNISSSNKRLLDEGKQYYVAVGLNWCLGGSLRRVGLSQEMKIDPIWFCESVRPL